MSKEWTAESVFDVLGCDISRKILLVASEEPASASELADRCDVSTPTVYRRINALQEFDMLDEQVAVADDGHHHKRFRTVLSEANVRLDDGEFTVDVVRTTDRADSLSGLWRDLEREAHADRGTDAPDPTDDRHGSPDAG